jgi:hypothetical protein
LLDISKLSNTLYWAFKKKIEDNPEMIANVEEVIVLDVSRSEHQMPGINPKTLLSILRAYALYNPEMEYC